MCTDNSSFPYSCNVGRFNVNTIRWDFCRAVKGGCYDSRFKKLKIEFRVACGPTLDSSYQLFHINLKIFQSSSFTYISAMYKIVHPEACTSSQCFDTLRACRSVVFQKIVLHFVNLKTCENGHSA